MRFLSTFLCLIYLDFTGYEDNQNTAELYGWVAMMIIIGNISCQFSYPYCGWSLILNLNCKILSESKEIFRKKKNNSVQE